jgi:hypothetical protein
LVPFCGADLRTLSPGLIFSDPIVASPVLKRLMAACA